MDSVETYACEISKPIYFLCLIGIAMTIYREPSGLHISGSQAHQGRGGIIMDYEGSTKYRETRDSLPEHLRSTFKRLVQEYAYHATVIYGKQWVSYQVLAELVREGWRPTDLQEGDSTNA